MPSYAALELVLRVSLLFAAAALAAVFLRRTSAAARHLLWALAIGGSLALPIVSAIAPRWELPLPGLAPGLSWTIAPAEADDSRNPRAVQGSAAARAATVEPGARGAIVARMPGRAARGDAADSARPSPAPNLPAAGRAWAAWPPQRILLALWLGGAALVLFRLALGSARMCWISRRARPAGPLGWTRLATRLAGLLGVQNRVVFLEGGPAAMPMTWGLLRPRVLLPASAAAWPPARQRVVLLHELAHVKRRDCLTQFLAQMACAIYWFNPLAWLAARQLRVEREHACDDLVLAAGTRGTEYADHLLEVARSLRTAALPTWAAVAMAHRSQLEGRLMAILDPALPRWSPSRRHAASLAAAVAILVVPIAAVTPVSQSPARSTGAASSDVAVATHEPASQERADDPRQEPAPQPRPSADRAPAPTPAPRPALAGAREEAALVNHVVRAVVPRTVAAARPAALDAVIGGIVHGVAGGLNAGPITDALLNGWPGQQPTGKPPVGGVAGGVPGGVDEDGPDGAGRKRTADPRAVAALIEALKDSDREVREHAIHALATLRAPEAIVPLRAALKDSSSDIREQAAFALGQMGDAQSVDALSAALGDEQASVREQAAFALGQIGDRRAVPALGRALADKNASVREQAAFALGQLDDRAAVAPLVTALKDASPDVREQAAFALGQIGDAAAVDPLAAALADSSASVREQAAFALGQIGDPRAIDALTAALKDPNPEVRRHAAFALGQLSQ